jgi:hypothetical protein
LRELASEEAQQDRTGSSFGQLLRDDLANVRLWSAHHLLELFADPSPEDAAVALTLIEAAAVGDSAAAFGERMWLDEWRRKHKVG